MNKFLIKSLVLIICVSISLFASQKETNNIAQLSSASLYNVNKSSLHETIKAYINNSKNLKALKIVENLSGETYIRVHKDNSKLKLYRSVAYFDNEEVGEIFAYFDESNNKKLNKEEIAWIKENQVIKIAVIKDYEPYDMIDENNKLFGFHF